MPGKDEWRAALENKLPPESDIVVRNIAITAQYASWYLEKPHLFKWAGMAAFASRQVGFALVLFDLMHAPSLKQLSNERHPSGFQALMESLLGSPVYFVSLMHTFAAERMFMADFDAVRKGNNSIYSDIAWAHAAYLHEGIAGVEGNCGESDEEYMLRGFRSIDEGAKLLAVDSGSAVARELIREGNILLLRHEQINTLQPVFDAVSPAGKVMVSFGSELDFSCGNPEFLSRKASFAGFAGYFETLTGMRSITSTSDRWEWIQQEVLPAWEQTDLSCREGSVVHRSFASMAAGEGDFLRTAAMSVSKLYRTAGLV